MSKINYRRKEWKIKVRVPPMLKPNRVIDPDSLYDRQKDKERWKKLVKDITTNGIGEEEE